jgi:hypothetical protein
MTVKPILVRILNMNSVLEMTVQSSLVKSGAGGGMRLRFYLALSTVALAGRQRGPRVLERDH